MKRPPKKANYSPTLCAPERRVTTSGREEFLIGKAGTMGKQRLDEVLPVRKRGEGLTLETYPENLKKKKKKKNEK